LGAICPGEIANLLDMERKVKVSIVVIEHDWEFYSLFKDARSQKNSEIVTVRSHVYSAVAEESIDQKQITLCREHCLPTIGLRNYIIKECAPEFVIIGRERVFLMPSSPNLKPKTTPTCCLLKSILTVPWSHIQFGRKQL
jgi:hypothetical protein